MATQYWIHPAIGVARMGGSTEFYLAPEVPGEVPNKGNNYKDNHHRVKRQAQRFRIFEYEDDAGGPRAVREITSDQATIVWSVHLVNRKAALSVSFPPAGPRNVGQPSADLIIDPGTVDIKASDTAKKLVGQFKGVDVQLGEIDMEDGTGRLLVLGGNGASESVPANEALPSFVNNDNWYDDTSDGIVSATVDLGDGAGPRKVDKEARVIGASPSFAPGIDNMVSLYDVAFQAATQTGTPNGPDVWKPAFNRDILPILQKTVILQWASERAASGHGVGTTGDFLESTQLGLLSDNNSDPNSAAFNRRRLVFGRLRIPGASSPPPDPPPGPQNMPALNDNMTVMPTQYALMWRWSKGDFDPGSPQAALAKLEDAPVEDQPALLDRAALDACIGGPFFPGIESWYVMSERDTFSEPIRIAPAIEPGHLTVGNAVPWQADYLDCGRGWWPAQRPNNVARIVNGQLERFHPWVPQSWGREDMVEKWNLLGFVIREGNRYIESEFQA